MVDRGLGRIIDSALARIETEMAQAAPFLAQRVSGWMSDLAGGSPGDYFRHPLGFPMLLIPWWLEKALGADPDPGFQADLVYSTINGYYYIRLIDNLMDGHGTVELELLPALAFFHTQFQSAYQRTFDHGHPFWAFYQRVWFESADVTMKDASLEDLGPDQFFEVAARKTCAAKIPAVAVCYRYERRELIGPWSRFLDLFGRWHQMWNDVFTWRKDVENGTRTYFLSEGGRQKRPDQLLAEWVIEEGLLWGIELLQTWMGDLRSASGHLGSPDLAGYLEERASMLATRRKTVEAGLQSAAKLLSLLEQTQDERR